ncbi:MAG TPA: hypothetical protein VJV21_04740 [Pyrinomonadaceae bacterium]|nr:hypothetical protein [Pyrinomonadaceae bacterium]
MSRKSRDKQIQDVYDQLSGEADQERSNAEERTSFLATVDSDLLREREREYRDPEKHWVRREAWLKAAKTLAREKGRRLRYLTLPSFYRLDVSMLLRENLLQVFKGDDNETIDYVYVAAFETEPSKYGRMVGHSPRFRLFGRGAIEDAIVDASNEYFEQLTGLFPFDIVNLDLTTSLTPQHEGPYSRIMQAIDVVFRRQVDCRGKWALFLTTRNVPEDWETEALKQLFSNLEKNLSQHPKAQQVFYQLYKESTVDGLSKTDPKNCISQAVVKWLTDRANFYGMHLESLRCYKYDRYSEGIPPYTISKYVFMFSKGGILPIRVPTKQTPRQPWMDDDVVTCISKHKLVDVQEKLLRLVENVPSAVAELEQEIQDLCDMIN